MTHHAKDKKVHEKIARITGMAAFAVVSIFALWYVDYESMRLTGFRANPQGYGSIAYWMINFFIGSDYGAYGTRNTAWIATQAFPLPVAWTVRARLGKGACRLYGAI